MKEFFFSQCKLRFFYDSHSSGRKEEDSRAFLFPACSGDNKSLENLIFREKEKLSINFSPLRAYVTPFNYPRAFARTQPFS